MIILSLRTDKPEAEIGVYEDNKLVDHYSWQAHRELAETLHNKIRELLTKNGFEWEDINGLIVYAGPGSFTGLRIGTSVANALAYSLAIPIVATKGDWIKAGLEKLAKGESDKLALPIYGSPVHTTKPSK